MSRCRFRSVALAWLAAGSMALLPACGGGGEPVAVADTGENMVWRWSQIAAATVNTVGQPAVTPEEQRPLWPFDLATVHAAMYDAVVAITRTHEPFAITPTAPTAGASADAAVMAAAHGVLKGLFPNRSVAYQVEYDTMLAALPDGDAKVRGLAVGAEVATGLLALRADDGRSTVVPEFVPGVEPGQFRGVNPVNPWFPHVRPFTMTSAAQFRASGPPALDSRDYADDVNEVKAWGGTTSARRTADQTEAARHTTEFPNVHWARNLAQFARSQPALVENARLMALLWVAMADTTLGCFESKYHFLFWRPASAITLADTDGNADTVADPTWTPLGPVPNHPAYPAAHGCVTSAQAQVLADFYGTRKLRFSHDSTVTGAARHYESLDDFVSENRGARIWGGMDFRTALNHGAQLGTSTARWVAKHHFRPTGD